jgi:hypothetical protein
MVAGIVLAAFGSRRPLPTSMTRLRPLPRLRCWVEWTTSRSDFEKRAPTTTSASCSVSRLFALIPVATTIPALAALAGLDVLLWAVIAYETIVVYDERRYRLRHGLDPDPEAPLGGERT